MELLPVARIAEFEQCCGQRLQIGQFSSSGQVDRMMPQPARIAQGCSGQNSGISRLESSHMMMFIGMPMRAKSAKR